MGNARYIGRVGALAITLGVGWAVASAPGVAYAEPTSSSSASDSSSTSASPSPGRTKRAKSSTSTSASSSGSDSESAADGDNAPAAKKTARDRRNAARAERAVKRDAAADESTTVVSMVAVKESTASTPLAEPGPEAPPAHTPVLLAALAAARDELERNAVHRTTVAPPQQVSALAADDTPNVLLIGVDGTNLSRVLADPTNANFFTVMQGGTTAASTIVGHTTISNPSWSSILTGAWGEKTGVINNVFTPWTYNKWPTVFNLLETQNPTIETTVLADWDVIAGIGGAGSVGADNITYVSQIAGDTNWKLTDDAVGDATEAAIAAADKNVGNFIFSYFVGVDENGHMYGGASDEYEAALNNVDRNIGEIMSVVDAWEIATGEQWTVIMVTDHGHRPEKGIGHGFQTPPETTTFVVANNPDIFTPGTVNSQYSIVDVTPTVAALFGFGPPADTDGVSLTDLSGSDVTPVNDNEALRTALQDAVAMYGSPDLGTQLRLDLRTIVTSVPYFVFGFTNSATASLQSLADQDIFLISLLAKVAILPVQLVGDAAYVATNVLAQVVAKLTGVEGASIFPLWPPAPPVTSTPDEATTLNAAAVCGAPGTTAVFVCGERAIATLIKTPAALRV